LNTVPVTMTVSIGVSIGVVAGAAGAWALAVLECNSAANRAMTHGFNVVAICIFIPIIRDPVQVRQSMPAIDNATKTPG
jgi:hypothetical protein